MVTIRNINESYGMPVSHTAETLEQAVAEMQEQIRACGDDFADVELTDDDYEIVSDSKQLREQPTMKKLNECQCIAIELGWFLNPDVADHVVTQLSEREGITRETAIALLLAVAETLKNEMTP